MNKILNVTFPRSGHFLLYILLREILGDKLDYCEFYNCNICRGVNAEQLCVRPTVNFQKHHDFIRLFYYRKYLTLRKDFDRKYLIQYREKIPALISWYEMFLNEGKGKVEDSPRGFKRFYKWSSQFYDKWFEKWVLDDEIKDKKIITYKELTLQPQKTLVDILDFMGVYDIDITFMLNRMVKALTLPKREIENFKYIEELNKIEK